MLRQLIDERGITDVDGVQDLVKELTSELIQKGMDEELEGEFAIIKPVSSIKSQSNGIEVRKGNFRSADTYHIFTTN